MEDKKYVIVWHQEDKTKTFFTGNSVTNGSYYSLEWSFALIRATPFSLCEAEAVCDKIKEYFKHKPNTPNNPWLKIHEYIPAQLGSETESEKDKILVELLEWQKHSSDYHMINHYRFFKRLFAFIEKNTK